MSQTLGPEKVVEDLREGVAELSQALSALLEAAHLADQRPLAMSRKLGVNKNITWKIARLAKRPNLQDAFQLLPGEAGFEILLDAAVQHGASPQSTDRARRAFKAVERVVEEHAGDRQRLEILLDGVDSSTERLLVSRKLAFRGNSGIWGVEARARIHVGMLVPSQTDPNMIDLVAIGGWLDFQRTRADAQWTMFRRTMAPKSDPTAVARFQPIDPNEPHDGPMLIRPFCTDSLPQINVIREPNNVIEHTLAPSVVGRTGAFDCFYGSVLRGIGSRFSSSTDDHGEVGAVVAAPVELLQFDLLVHRSLGFEQNAAAYVYGSASSAERRERDLLPISLGRSDPIDVSSGQDISRAMNTPAMGRYPDLLQWVASTLKLNLLDYRAVRFTLDYPPYPSTVVVKFPLAIQPTANH